MSSEIVGWINQPADRLRRGSALIRQGSISVKNLLKRYSATICIALLTSCAAPPKRFPIPPQSRIELVVPSAESEFYLVHNTESFSIETSGLGWIDLLTSAATAGVNIAIRRANEAHTVEFTKALQAQDDHRNLYVELVEKIRAGLAERGHEVAVAERPGASNERVVDIPEQGAARADAVVSLRDWAIGYSTEGRGGAYYPIVRLVLHVQGAGGSSEAARLSTVLDNDGEYGFPNYASLATDPIKARQGLHRVADAAAKRIVGFVAD